MVTISLNCWRAELFAKGRRLRRARTVEQAEAFAFRHQLPDHRHHRRHPDASGDEQEILRTRRQPEVVHGRRDNEFVAGFNVVDEARRTAAAGHFALDRNLITVALGGIVAQRIFAQQTVRHAHGNVRAPRECGKFPAGSRNSNRWMPSAILSLRVTRSGIVGGGGLAVIIYPARAA